MISDEQLEKLLKIKGAIKYYYYYHNADSLILL